MTMHAPGPALVRAHQLEPIDIIDGFHVRPGFFRDFGATPLPGGVNFTIQSHGATSCELLLFHREEDEPFAVLKFPENYRIGFVYSMIVFDLDVEDFEYAYRLDGPYDEKKGLRFDSSKILLDPYARAVTGQSGWGHNNFKKHGYRARVVRSDFDWGSDRHSQIPMEDLIIYELHIRGFTKSSSSNVSTPGTFHGVEEKIPYLKELGINAVELMPIFEFDEMRDARSVNGNQLLDYWGYNPVSFFAPNTSYSSSVEYNHEGNELKRLIRTLHEHDIEVILDVVFNHTAEGNEDGTCFSFKGIDNNIYYMLTPDGKYFNFSGCGNTLNCNHPVVQEMILDCLRHWVIEYRVDGFRFDLASILGRNENGEPMNQPPLLRNLAFDSILGGIKLIAEAWDAGGLYQVGSFPSWKRWAEWNGRYRDDIRSFLKGDSKMASTAAQRMIGSPDLYDPVYRGGNASVNFITCHDGFTLCDLYSYNEKHNEANGWNNTDGSDDNKSWNCGTEGQTDDPTINLLRFKMMKNACAVLMCSRGTPMFLSGDEFADTRYGNNNPYCQDNETSWLNWALLNRSPNKELFQFFQYMIEFRKQHPAIRRDLEPSHVGFPSMSLHAPVPTESEHFRNDHVCCILFAGYEEETNKEDLVFVAINSHWNSCELTPPTLPETYEWRIAVNTGDPQNQFFTNGQMPVIQHSLILGERSVIVFVGEKR